MLAADNANIYIDLQLKVESNQLKQEQELKKA